MGLFSSGGSYNRTGSTYGKNSVGITATYAAPLIFNVSSNELWIKVNYFAKSGNECQLMLTFSAGSETIVIMGTTSSHSMVSTITGNNISGSISTDSASIDEFLFHIKSDSTSGIFEIYKNGVKEINFSNVAILAGNKINTLSFASTYWSDNIAVLSDFIISDEEILPSEQVAILSAASTSTTMTDNGDGSYTAAAVDQTILQSINTSNLSSQMEITGICLAGYPAYRTDDTLTSLIAISNDGSGSTEHGACTVPTVKTKYVLNGWKDSISFSKVSEMKFGWKSGA